MTSAFGLRCALATIFLSLGVASAEYCQARYGDVATEESEEDDKDMTGWILGVIMCVASAFASVMGVTFQKKAHNANEKLPVEERKPYVKLKLWWIGIGCVIAGAILDFISLGFAPQTVVASLGSLTLVINATLAPITLGEKLSRLELAGTVTIMIGAAIAVASSSQKSQEYNLDVLKCLFRETGFIIYAVVIVLWCSTLVLVFRKCDRLESSRDPSYYPVWAKLHPVSIAALSGTLGAQSLLFAKGVSIILRGVYQPAEGGDGGKAFAQFETYLILGAMIFTIVTQTHTLNMGLQMFDSVVILPLFQVFWIIMGVMGAGAYFKEFDGMETTSLVLFPIGILVIALGIGVLSSRGVEDDFEKTIASLSMPDLASETYKKKDGTDTKGGLNAPIVTPPPHDRVTGSKRANGSVNRLERLLVPEAQRYSFMAFGSAGPQLLGVSTAKARRSIIEHQQRRKSIADVYDNEIRSGARKKSAVPELLARVPNPVQAIANVIDPSTNHLMPHRRTVEEGFEDTDNTPKL